MVNQPVGPVSLPVHTPPRLTSYRRLIHDLIQSWIVITVLNMKNGQRALYTLSTEYSEWTESSELCPLGVKSTLSGQSTHASSRKHTKEKSHKQSTLLQSVIHSTPAAVKWNILLCPFWNPWKGALQHHLLVRGCQWDWLSWRTQTSRHQWLLCWGGRGRVNSPWRSCPSHTSDALRYRVGLHYCRMMQAHREQDPVQDDV